MTTPGCWSTAGSTTGRTPASARNCCAAPSPEGAYRTSCMPIMPIRRLCRGKRNGPGHWRDRAVADGITEGSRSEVFEEFQERVRRLVAFLAAAGRGGFPDGFLLL